MKGKRSIITKRHHLTKAPPSSHSCITLHSLLLSYMLLLSSHFSHSSLPPLHFSLCSLKLWKQTLCDLISTSTLYLLQPCFVSSSMAVLVLLTLILSMAGHSSATWCVCKEGVGDSALQKTLDYACGAGADCGPIHSNGACFSPNTLKAHCNYAVNSYFQKKGQAQGSCDFSGSATISTSDPSTAGCSYPSSATSSTTTTPSTTPVTTKSPTTSMPTTTGTTTTTSPYTTTPSNGASGGVGTGAGPSGAGINTDYNHGGLRLRNSNYFSPSKMLFFSGLMLLWG